MSQTQGYRYLQVTISLALHGAAYAVFLLDSSSLPHLQQLRYQLPLLFGLSYALSILCAFQARETVRIVCVLARFFVVSVASYGLGRNLGIELFLMLSLIFDCMFSLRLSATIITLSVGIPISILIREPVSVWGSTNPGMRPADKLVLGGVLLLTSLLAVMLKASWRTNSRHRGDLDRMNIAVQNLTAANEGFQKYAVSAKEHAAQKERNRISREVHDSVGYALTNILMMARVGSRLVLREPDKVREIFDNIFGQAQDGLNEMRFALRLLRAKDHEPAHGVKAIQRLVNAFETSSGVRVRVDYANARWAENEDLDTFVFRFVQEGMTNAFRHGHATEIRVTFWQDDGWLLLRIGDNGCGSSDSSQGIGLSGMRERIQEIGGTLETRSSRHGFVVTAKLPIGTLGRNERDAIEDTPVARR